MELRVTCAGQIFIRAESIRAESPSKLGQKMPLRREVRVGGTSKFKVEVYTCQKPGGFIWHDARPGHVASLAPSSQLGAFCDAKYVEAGW